MATRSQQLDWQEIHLSEDEASAQGTHAVRFLVQQVEKAQNNSLSRPMLNNLMRAHGLQLLNYEPPTQDPTFQEVLNEGNTREEREDHSQDDASSGRSRSPSRRTRRPLEREDNSLRNRVQESGSKRRRSPSREVSSSPSPRGRKREWERHARRRHKSKRTPSPSNSPSKRSSFSSSSSSDGYSSSGHHKRRRHDTYRAWKRSRKLQKFKEGGKSIAFQTYDGSYGAIDKVLSFIQQFVSHCIIFQKVKFDRGKQPGLLQSLPIPDFPRESIAMDFIFGLPKSIHGNTRIWRIVDMFMPVRLRLCLFLSEFVSMMDGYKEEGSSSQDRQSNSTVHEVGEGSSQAEEGFPHAAFSITGTASPGTLFGGMQSMVPNLMYANIGLHPGFQATQGQFGMSQGNLGMAGFSIPPVNMTPKHQHVTGQGVQMAPTGVIATVCMFLAGKVEETPERLQNVILVSYELRNEEDPDATLRIKQKDVYDEQKELLLMGERLVLVTLGFNLNVSHPYKPLIAAIKRLVLPQTISRSQLAQIAWNFVNDGLQTLVCLQFKPRHVAAGALFLAAKCLRIKLCDWEELLSKEFVISLQQLEDVSNRILQSYESLAESSSSGGLGVNKLIQVGGNLKKQNETTTYSVMDFGTGSTSARHEGDYQWPSSHSKMKIEDKTETTMLQKTHNSRFDVENATCHTGHSDLTEEKEVPDMGRSYLPEEHDWEFDGVPSHEEFDRSNGYLSPVGVDGWSTGRQRLFGRERKVRGVSRDSSPDEKGSDSTLMGIDKHKPWIRISSRHRSFRQVLGRREPLVGLFGMKKDARQVVTRRDFLLRLSSKKKLLKGGLATPERHNMRLQNRLNLLRQKDEILKKHCYWGSREYRVK
ncbi:hypothetical protein L7F22_067468 [Adiantum nelumboides]|nr:hypothetical protein [Adiantum nelumboides]